jgi:HlyD family secretion protein
VTKKLIRWSVAITLAVAAFGASAYLLQTDPLEVETGRVQCGPMQATISAEGRTRVRDRFVISSPVEGKLGRLDVKEGSVVKRGAILGWLTPSPLDVRSEQQREAAVETAEAERQVAEAEVERAKVELEHAANELRRMEGLVQDGVWPRRDLDAAQSAHAAAQQSLRAATFVLTAAASHVEEIRSSLVTGEMHSMTIRSPIDGIVLRVLQKSERIVTSGTPIVELADSRKLELVFEVLSTDAVRIPADATVIIENWGGEDLIEGRVRLTEPGAFTKISALGVEEQRVNVIADLPGEYPALGDGYRVDGEIVTWESPEVTQVPVSALFRTGNEWSVFVVENDRVWVRPVQIGHRNQKNAEVTGLDSNHVVVLYPDDRLKDGLEVRTAFEE